MTRFGSQPLLFIACLAVVHLTSCAVLQSSHSDDLPALICQRLAWMDEVAQIKLARGLPVTDAKREEELLKAMEGKGRVAGLPSSVTRLFFAGQIEAAKAYQTQWMKRMSRPKAKPSELPDLATVVRPALDAIGQRMIVALVKARAGREQQAIIDRAQQRLQRAGHSPEVIAPAMAGLKSGLGSHDP